MVQSRVKTFQTADLYRLKFLHGAQFSPDGQRLVYAVSHIDEEKEQEFVTLWLLTLETGETQQLTFGLAKDMYPQWSPDGKEIAFLSTRGPKPQLYLIAANGGEARQLTYLEQGVTEGPMWSPDGQAIAFAASPKFDTRDTNKPYRITRPTYRFEGLGYIEDALQEIFAVSVADGNVWQITHDNCVCSSPRWSPNGNHILYIASMLPDTMRNIWPGLRVLTLSNSRVSTVVGAEGRVSSAEWLPNGKQIAYIAPTPDDSVSFATKDDLWVVEFDEVEGVGTPESRTAGLKYGVGSRLQPDVPIWHLLKTPILCTAGGEQAYITVQIGGALQIYRVALKGPEAWQPIVEGERAALLLDAHLQQNLLAYAVSTLNRPPDLFTFSLATGEEQERTALNESVLAERTQAEIENFRVITPENVEVEAWFMRPPVGDPPYPTVLYIHGGPYGSFGEVFNFDFQILTGAGYAVLLPNFRGSGGYGTDFSKAVVGNWGDVVYADNMATVDYVIAQGLADPNRLGICGYSHGGFATCWTIGHTNRFKAAVPENAVTNWISAYSVSDAGVTWISAELGGHPHEIPEVYLRKSPIMYAHNCTTPTLLVVGENDYRCPPEESEQFYMILKAHDCTVEMLRLPNSTHIGSFIGPVIVRQAQNEALIDWFDRYLK